MSSDTTQSELIDVLSEEQRKDARRRGYALQNLGFVAASYAVDTLLIAGFALAGTVYSSVPWSFGLAALVVCLTALSLIRRDITVGDRDRNLSAFQMAGGTLIMVGGIFLEPRLAFLFLNILFINYAFGTLRLGIRPALIGWFGMSVLSSAAILSVWTQLEIPHATRLEVMLVTLTYSLTLLRFVATGLYGSSLRRRVHQQNEKLAAATAEISRLVNYDDLTGALNRRGVLAQAQRDFEMAQRNGECLSVIQFDVDHFKRINDSYGHAEGDRVLQRIAEATRVTLRTTDLFGRVGGEEFLIVLPHTWAHDALKMAERLRAEIAQTVSVGQPPRPVTASFGVASFNSKADDLTSLQGAADRALYHAKLLGRNRVVSAAELEERANLVAS